MTIKNLLDTIPTRQKLSIYVIQYTTEGRVHKAGYFHKNGKIHRTGKDEEISPTLREYLETLPVARLYTFGKRFTAEIDYENFLG